MGTVERKEKERLTRRQDVIDAAEALFMEKGYEHATMDDIAMDAGFTKKTIYAYFSSKDEISMEIMLKGFKALNKLIDDTLALNINESSIESIRCLGLAFADFSQKYPYYYKIITNYENKERDFNPSNPSKLVDDCYIAGQYSMQHLEAFIKAGISKKEILDDTDPKIIALVLWSSVTGLINIIGRKEKYIAAYFNDNTNLILLEGLKLILNAIRYKTY